MLFNLSIASLFSRKPMVFLTCFSIAISMLVLASVAHIESQVRQNFERSVSGVDLIVGSRTSQLNLLLFSIFRLGNPSNNMAWQSFAELASNKQVSWAVPIVLGDSHQGYAVVGTTLDYFEHVKFAQQDKLSLQEGKLFMHNEQLVLGATVARDLGYQLQDEIVLSHGAGKVSFSQHKNHPFTIVGILNATGTPMDRAIYMPIEAVDSLHGSGSSKQDSHAHGHEYDGVQEHHNHAEHPQAISAALVGVNSKIALLSLQRIVSQNKTEPLTAILPNVALHELWQMMSVVELSLKVIAVLVLFASLIGMTTMLLASMRERQRELSVLRALGARPWVLIWLVEVEALLITLLGCILGYVFLSLGLTCLQPVLLHHYAFNIARFPEPLTFLGFTGLALGLAGMLALIPALLSYKKSLSGGLRFP